MQEPLLLGYVPRQAPYLLRARITLVQCGRMPVCDSLLIIAIIIAIVTHFFASLTDMVLFGGKGVGNTALNDLYVLDCNTLTWHHVAHKGDPPSPRFNHACTIAGNQFFVRFCSLVTFHSLAQQRAQNVVFISGVCVHLSLAFLTVPSLLSFSAGLRRQQQRARLQGRPGGV